MKLYLVRHAEAEPKDVPHDRHLTERGRADAKKLSAAILPVRLKVDVIWHSGRARAQETAEAIAPAVISANGVLQRQGIDSDDPIKPIIAEIEQANRDVMIVGHEPFLGKLASRLITRKKRVELFELDKPSILKLEFNGKKWSAQWLLSREILDSSPSTAEIEEGQKLSITESQAQS